MILDACCGSLKIYKGMVDGLIQSSEFITVDRRKGDFSYKNEGDVWWIYQKTNTVKQVKATAQMRFELPMEAR